ncbi:MAG: MGMT family protein [Cyanobacteria bacterium P01_G01_bin.19]
MGDRGYVEHLFIKQERKQPLLPCDSVNLLERYGIERNINSDRSSPRQVLVVNAQDLNSLSITPGELRENIVLKDVDANYFKPGAKLVFSDGAAIRLTFYCEPCKRVEHLVNSLKSIEHKRGILGVVIQEGKIAQGDRVTIKPDYFPALSEIPYERFLELVKQIPEGRVITYRQILTSIGVDRSYYRVMPIYIKKAPLSYPIHRILDSQGRSITHIPHHREKLAAEGVEIKSDRTIQSWQNHLWQNPSICYSKINTG